MRAVRVGFAAARGARAVHDTPRRDGRAVHAPNEVLWELRVRRYEQKRLSAVDTKALTAVWATRLVAEIVGKEAAAGPAALLLQVAQWCGTQLRAGALTLPELTALIEQFARLSGGWDKAEPFARRLASALRQRGVLNRLSSRGGTLDGLMFCVDIAVELVLRCTKSDAHAVVLQATTWVLDPSRFARLGAKGLVRLLTANARLNFALLGGGSGGYVMSGMSEMSSQDAERMAGFRDAVAGHGARLAAVEGAFSPPTAAKFIHELPPTWMQEDPGIASLVRGLVAAYAGAWSLKELCRALSACMKHVHPAAPYPLHHRLFDPILDELTWRSGDVRPEFIPLCIGLLCKAKVGDHAAFAAFLRVCRRSDAHLAALTAALRRIVVHAPPAFTAGLGELLAERAETLDLWSCRFALQHRAQLALPGEAVEAIAGRWMTHPPHAQRRWRDAGVRAAYVMDFIAQFKNAIPAWVVVQLVPSADFRHYTLPELRFMAASVARAVAVEKYVAAAQWLDALRPHLAERASKSPLRAPDRPRQLYCEAERSKTPRSGHTGRPSPHPRKASRRR